MSRLMSVTLTEAAVVARQKTVTRRLGWEYLEPGDRLTLCRKVQGRRRKDGTVEPLVRLAEVEVVSVRRERLNAIRNDDVAREGFETDPNDPRAPSEQFVSFFVKNMRCWHGEEVTRIEWRYLDGGVS